MSIVQPLPLQSEAPCVCARPYSARWLGPANGQIVIDLHWLYIYDVRLQAIFRNLLSRQDPLKQLCVVCARRYLRDSNNDSEIKLSQVEFTIPWILLVMFIVHVEHLEFSLCYRGLQSIPVVRNILVVSAGTFVKQASLSWSRGIRTFITTFL